MSAAKSLAVPPPSPPAAQLKAPAVQSLADLPGLIRPALTLARRGRVVLALQGDPEPVRTLAAALLAFGLPEDALLSATVPAGAMVLPETAPVDAWLNQLPLFPARAEIDAFVGGLSDDGRLPGEAKDPTASPIFAVFARLADPVRTETLRLRFLGGISWEDARLALASLIARLTAEAAERFPGYLAAADALDDLIATGTRRAASLTGRLAEPAGAGD